MLSAGAAIANITPTDSQFLFGYPHVKRYSTGIHDPLLSSALYISDGRISLLFVANDIIFVGKSLAHHARQRIAETIPVPQDNIMISATHTHSGPITVDYLSNEADPAVPKADPKYLKLFEDGIVAAAVAAYHRAVPAQVGLTVANGTGVGTNRRDPSGPSDPDVPVLMVRTTEGHRPMACMVVCSMHPTVLHEDSTLVSGDFPGMTRSFLQQSLLGNDCPVLYHTGPAGNQSPRHVTRANTFAEAERLGQLLGKAIAEVIPHIRYDSELFLASSQQLTDLPTRPMPSTDEAKAKLAKAIQRLEQLRQGNASRQEIRTAECDEFGAEETMALAQAAHEGRLRQAYASCLPAEIQLLGIGPWNFVGWPGEIFIEYALALKERYPKTWIISLANGELQGYIVTPEAAKEGGYEASNALLSPKSGSILVEKTGVLLDSRMAISMEQPRWKWSSA
jgi:hypothetical protein